MKILLAVLLLSWGAAVADEPGMELLARGPATIEAGASARLSLTVVPRTGERILEAGPFDVRVHGDGVEVVQPIFHKVDAVDAKAEAPRFEIEIKGQKATTAHVTARVRLYLCAAQQCRPVEAHTEWALEVRPKP